MPTLRPLGTHRRLGTAWPCVALSRPSCGVPSCNAKDSTSCLWDPPQSLMMDRAGWGPCLTAGPCQSAQREQDRGSSHTGTCTVVPDTELAFLCALLAPSPMGWFPIWRLSFRWLLSCPS